MRLQGTYLRQAWDKLLTFAMETEVLVTLVTWHWHQVSHYHRHLLPCPLTSGTGAQGGGCLFWHNIHWSLIWSDRDQDQSDDDCDVIRIMARDTSDIMTSVILTPIILTFLTPGHLGSPVPLTTVPGQDDERQFQEKLLWVKTSYLNSLRAPPNIWKWPSVYIMFSIEFQ